MDHRVIRVVIALGAMGILGAGCVVVPHPGRGHGGAVVVAPAPVVLTARPRMVFVAEFGVSFAPDLDLEVYEVDGVWYSYRSARWYSARGYDGPWVVIHHRRLPPGLAKVKPGQVKNYYREHGPHGKAKGRGHGKGD